MRLHNPLLNLLIAHALLLPASVARAADPLAENVAIGSRSVVSPADRARLEHVLANARRGQPVTIGVIGGSITQGALASAPEKRYGDLVAQWWRQNFPDARIEFVNAGIGATGSDYGALRAARDLLWKHPDFVVVEYAVNDANTQSAAESLEGLLRQILDHPQKPAVVLLFMMSQGGNNAQEWQAKLGRHYGLPMVSFRDALWPEINSGRIAWNVVIADQVHPNDRGHALAAHYVTAFLEKALRQLPGACGTTDLPPLPRPLVSDLFQHTALYEADALTPVINHGWSYDPALKAWKSDKPASAIEFELDGRVLLTMHYVVKGPMGKATVSVDGRRARQLDGWFDQTWGGYRQTNEVARLLNPARHRLRLEISPDHSSGSTGHEFRILGLGAAGSLAP